MPFFRKKPVVIEARQFVEENATELALWCGGRVDLKVRERPHSVRGQLAIPTLEGTMTATLDDWIIKGVKGEFYPCKPDIFDVTYEAIT